MTSVPRFTAHGFHDIQNQQHVAFIHQSLRDVGISVIDLRFFDGGSVYLSDLILALGHRHGHGPPIPHSGTQGWYWDVRPKEKGANRARSETSQNFPWHTDCSYESQPPQYFGLHVLHADQYGGGTLRIMNTARLLGMLSNISYESLSRPEFQIKVPPEFYKGIASIYGNVIKKDDKGDSVCVRYRSDIFQPVSSGAEKALREFDELLGGHAENVFGNLGIELTAKDLPDNSIVLIDNGRWLHSRTEINDSQRHLRRVRWGRRDFTE